MNIQNFFSKSLLGSSLLKNSATARFNLEKLILPMHKDKADGRATRKRRNKDRKSIRDLNLLLQDCTLIKSKCETISQYKFHALATNYFGKWRYPHNDDNKTTDVRHESYTHSFGAFFPLNDVLSFICFASQFNLQFEDIKLNQVHVYNDYEIGPDHPLLGITPSSRDSDGIATHIQIVDVYNYLKTTKLVVEVIVKNPYGNNDNPQRIQYVFDIHEPNKPDSESIKEYSKKTFKDPCVLFREYISDLFPEGYFESELKADKEGVHRIALSELQCPDKTREIIEDNRRYPFLLDHNGSNKEVDSDTIHPLISFGICVNDLLKHFKVENGNVKSYHGYFCGPLRLGNVYQTRLWRQNAKTIFFVGRNMNKRTEPISDATIFLK